MKDTTTTPTPDKRGAADNDADASARRNPDLEQVNSRVEAIDNRVGDPSAVTTEHLRRLWMAGARDITVTYDADVVRHRTYLSRPRTDK